MNKKKKSKTKGLTRSLLLNKKQTLTRGFFKLKYYFIIGSQNFLLKEEPLEEVLRERFQYCLREKKAMNFWLIKSPKFLQSQKMNLLQTRLPQKSVVILSTSEMFARWLKLRYHHVGIGSFISPSFSIPNALGRDPI